MNVTIEQKMSTILTMASEVAPGEESSGLFWCHGRGEEPPFATMICLPTLLAIIAAHPDVMAHLNEIATTK